MSRMFSCDKNSSVRVGSVSPVNVKAKEIGEELCYVHSAVIQFPGLCLGPWNRCGALGLYLSSLCSGS